LFVKKTSLRDRTEGVKSGRGIQLLHNEVPQAGDRPHALLGGSLGDAYYTGLSPHSFRVAMITALFTQGVPLEDVQYLAGPLNREPLGFMTDGKRR
jgi:hypothetical protein